MRSPKITRLYFQVPPDEDIASWSDEAIWDEMLKRMTTCDGWKPNVGPILNKNVTAMRSFVTEPMNSGRLFLAGDSAHIVPPTGAKGLNLAAADVLLLGRAIAKFYCNGSTELLDRYSCEALKRVWKSQRFSWWMTQTLHRFPGENPFDYKRQLADLEYITGSKAAMTSLAENYVGLPLDTSI
jgi:p-hydroxybenzoate 3-monooxygenase